MATQSVASKDFTRIVRAVEKSAAKDDSRPALAGIHARLSAEALTLTAADGYRLSTAHAALVDAEAAPSPDAGDVAAILERAPLLAFLKLVNPKHWPLVTIDPSPEAWTFAANGASARVPTMDGTFPDCRQLLGTGEEPELFAMNARYLAETLASHGTDMVRLSRTDAPNSAVFFTAQDGTRHVIMPMVAPANDAATWPRHEDPQPAPEPAVDEPEPAPSCAECGGHEITAGVCVECHGSAAVTPQESAFRSRRAARARVTVKRAARRTQATTPTTTTTDQPGAIATAAPRCATCDTQAQPDDNYCAECGTPLGVSQPAPVAAAIAGDPEPVPPLAPVTKLSPRERAAHAQEELAAAVAALKDSDAWQRQLATIARFHTYSVNNQMLIAWQRPDATYVRGFRAWLDAGRAVRKGEKGISIFAPRPWERTECDDAGEERTERGLAFTVVKVFDVAQTDPVPGHANPWQPPQRHAATGDIATARAVWNAMLDVAADRDIEVTTDARYAPAAGAYGYYAHTLGRIWVRPDRALADMAVTLAHELAHAVTQEAVASLSREVREVVAESVAYAVGTHYGLDLALRSTHYVASWLDDADAFKAGMAAIHDGAATLIAALDAMLAGVPLPLAA